MTSRIAFAMDETPLFAVTPCVRPATGRFESLYQAALLEWL